MANIDRAAGALREMDELAAQDSPLHRLHPLAKLLATVVYICVTASFDRYDLSGLAAMALYPAYLFAASGIPLRRCIYKLRFVLLPVCAVGLFNPLLDRAPLLRLGTLAVSGGTVSMLTLLLKGAFCLSASFLLAATTPMDAVCAALRRLRVPDMLVTLLLLTYRYLSVLTEEAATMMTAYRLRAPGQNGLHYKAWGSFLGQLLLRSMDRAEALYAAMLLRGFSGEFQYAAAQKAAARDYVFCIAAVGCTVLCRCVNVADILGRLVV